MHIDSYQFGQIVIDGKSYSSDIIIIGETVHPNWWRKEGHRLSAEDLDVILAAKPDTLVIGCGAYGIMKVSKEAQKVLEENDIKFEAVDTKKAVQRFNELAKTDMNTAAAFHLTC